MVLSVVVYSHSLTLGQWAGAAVVFAGISVEAWVERKGRLSVFDIILVNYTDKFTVIIDIHAKRVIQEKEKARIKSL